MENNTEIIYPNYILGNDTYFSTKGVKTRKLMQLLNRSYNLSSYKFIIQDLATEIVKIKEDIENKTKTIDAKI